MATPKINAMIDSLIANSDKLSEEQLISQAQAIIEADKQEQQPSPIEVGAKEALNIINPIKQTPTNVSEIAGAVMEASPLPTQSKANTGLSLAQGATMGDLTEAVGLGSVKRGLKAVLPTLPEPTREQEVVGQSLGALVPVERVVPMAKGAYKAVKGAGKKVLDILPEQAQQLLSKSKFSEALEKQVLTPAREAPQKYYKQMQKLWDNQINEIEKLNPGAKVDGRMADALVGKAKIAASDYTKQAAEEVQKVLDSFNLEANPTLKHYSELRKELYPLAKSGNKTASEVIESLDNSVKTNFSAGDKIGKTYDNLRDWYSKSYDKMKRTSIKVKPQGFADTATKGSENLATTEKGGRNIEYNKQIQEVLGNSILSKIDKLARINKIKKAASIAGKTLGYGALGATGYGVGKELLSH